RTSFQFMIKLFSIYPNGFRRDLTLSIFPNAVMDYIVETLHRRQFHFLFYKYLTRTFVEP
ncbi:MAG: hypothetical protein ACXAAP_12040, partial [Candidatus Thorarchaeota archaeon]